MNTILVAVDFSEASEAALIEADYIAMWENGELVISHVIALSEAESLVKLATPSEEVFASVRNKLMKFTEDVTNLCENRTYSVCVGHPFHETMRIADDVDADLLVIGSHGRTERHNYVGSIASRCIRHSKVPVLLVRRQHDRGYRKVLACMDFSESAEEALKYGAEIANNEGAELHILHVWVDPWGIYAFPTDSLNRYLTDGHLDAVKDSAGKRLEKAKADILERYPGAIVSTSVSEASSVTKGIVDFIEERKIDLTVIGKHGHTKISEYLIGTTTERLVHKSPCSVLTVRSK